MSEFLSRMKSLRAAMQIEHDKLMSEIPIQHQLHGNTTQLERSLVRLDIQRIKMIADVRAARAIHTKIPKCEHLKCERAEEQLLVHAELEKELARMESELVRGF